MSNHFPANRAASCSGWSFLLLVALLVALWAGLWPVYATSAQDVEPPQPADAVRRAMRPIGREGAQQQCNRRRQQERHRW